MSTQSARFVIDRLAAAINDHDLDALAACFEKDFESEQPVHPARSFTGRAQVRKNWAQIFRGIPDLRAELVRAAVDGDTAWAEWNWSGTRVDGARHHLRGVTVLGIRGDQAAWVRFYMEPVEQGGATIDGAVADSVAAGSRS
ncbi:MAG: nuclear transport factor 2 family protein [Chloroflexota bacterium]|nr:nuclear transport factor 2 family protein [Chloroflexota bacterium]